MLVQEIANAIIPIVIICIIPVLIAAIIVPWACEHDGEPWFSRHRNGDDLMETKQITIEDINKAM